MAKPETRNKAKRDSTTKAFFIPHIILGFSWDGGQYPGLLPGGTFPFCATVRYTFPRLFQRRLHILKTICPSKFLYIDIKIRRSIWAHNTSLRVVGPKVCRQLHIVSDPIIIFAAVETFLQVVLIHRSRQELSQFTRLRLVVLYRVVD